jgi:hypothetical protein
VEKKINKTFEIEDFKVDSKDGKIYISGYANTKGHADSYGDVPTNYLKQPVYDITRMQKNPVMFADHNNSIKEIMGNFVELEEDKKGLRFKALLRNPETIAQPGLKDGITAFRDGFARALSIGGMWKFEDPKNPTHLTKAIIHEISGVGVGADHLSLTNTPKPKSDPEQETPKASPLEQVEALVAEYRKSKDDSILEQIEEIKKGVL